MSTSFQGGYYCGSCKAGYVGSGNGTCQLGDFCAIGKHNCHQNATCIPISAGKFKCKVCKRSFVWDVFLKIQTQFADVH